MDRQSLIDRLDEKPAGELGAATDREMLQAVLETERIRRDWPL